MADTAAVSHGHGTGTGLSNNKLLMWVFLGSECLLFGGLISTYLIYRNRFGAVSYTHLTLPTKA